MTTTATPGYGVDRSLKVPMPGLVCECLERIVARDIAQGYHRCGRTLQLVIGPPNFGVGR